jgi:cysteine desulfurase
VGAYFDHNATTPLDPRVREAMLPWLGERFGNASSAHRWGQAAREAIEAARDRVAALVGASSPLEVLFTGSGTEANNAVVADALARGGRIVVSALEHPSILGPLDPERAPGARVAQVAPDRRGVVDAARMIAEITEETALVALMLANNEIGTLQPVAEVAAACRERGVPLLCDAVQAVGKIPVDVRSLGADYLSVGAHKFHGPLGAAALWIRPGAPFTPYLVGGSQERRRRASTANVPALVGFGVACGLAQEELEARAARLGRLRDRFEAALAAALPEAVVHGAAAPRLPHTSSVAIPGVSNHELMIRLDLEGYAVSVGSACASGHVTTSPVLRAMGVPHELAAGTLRVSFGSTNDEAEVDAFVPVLERAARALATAAASR